MRFFYLKQFALLFQATLCFLLLLSNNGSGQSLPFSSGEVLTYQIRWSFIPAAEAKLAIAAPKLINDIPAQHFTLTARTYPAIDLIYKFRQQIDSYTDLTMKHSLLYLKKQQGKRTRDITVTFDWSKMQAQYQNLNEQLPPIELMDGTLDPLSAFYVLRTLPLFAGGLFERPITDGKKNVIGKAQVLKEETLEINGQIYKTFKVEPDLQHVKGVFEKSKDAKMFIWITADERRLLVRLKSKVVVGSFVADLINYTPGH